MTRNEYFKEVIDNLEALGMPDVASSMVQAQVMTAEEFANELSVQIVACYLLGLCSPDVAALIIFTAFSDSWKSRLN